jgi:hypothetical protein
MGSDGAPLQLQETAGRQFGVLIVSQVRFLRESLAEIFGRDGYGTVLGLCADPPHDTRPVQVA